jgi:hypothetical protein
MITSYIKIRLTSKGKIEYKIASKNAQTLTNICKNLELNLNYILDK